MLLIQKINYPIGQPDFRRKSTFDLLRARLSMGKNYVRIENSKFGSRGIVYTSVFFLVSFIICLILGSTGPTVIEFKNNGLSYLPVNADGVAEWFGTIGILCLS